MERLLPARHPDDDGAGADLRLFVDQGALARLGPADAADSGIGRDGVPHVAALHTDTLLSMRNFDLDKYHCYN